MITGEKLSYYINEAKGLENLSLKHSIKIAIMSSFTLNGLEQVLRVKCKENNINCQTYVSPYNQYFQEILNDESEIYKFKPDLTYLILDSAERLIFRLVPLEHQFYLIQLHIIV